LFFWSQHDCVHYTDHACPFSLFQLFKSLVSVILILESGDNKLNEHFTHFFLLCGLASPFLRRARLAAWL